MRPKAENTYVGRRPSEGEALATQAEGAVGTRSTRILLKTALDESGWVPAITTKHVVLTTTLWDVVLTTTVCSANDDSMWCQRRHFALPMTTLCIAKDEGK